jgi:hypothetical protein
MERKWTDGLPYERSRRLKHLAELEHKELIEENTKFSVQTENAAYTSALNYDENTWDILNQSLSGAGFKVSNKREELDSKISDRHLIQQTGFNPFLSENNYVNDIETRDKFLKPVNTTTDRIKTSNDN